MSDRLLEELIKTLQAPVVAVRDAEGKLIGAKREAPPEPQPQGDWEKTLDKWLAAYDKVNERSLVSATKSMALIVHTLAKGIAKRREEIETLEAAVAELQTEVRQLRNKT